MPKNKSQLGRRVSRAQVVSVLLIAASLGLVIWWRVMPLKPVTQTIPQQLEMAVPVPATPLAPVADIPIFQVLTASSSASVSANLDPSFAAQQTKITESLSARSLYALDVDSATPLVAKNAESLEYPASTTKLMTALVARQGFSLDTQITITSDDRAEGSVIGLQPGEVLTVKDLLAAVLIQSANDAAVTLANHYQGGAPAFVMAMNQEAKVLHLNQTAFVNADGIDSDHQQTTARDLSITARQVILDPVLAELVSTKSLTITDVNQSHAHTLHNTNALLGEEPGVIGLKTGTTDLAKEVLITLVQRDNHRVLIVLMGSQNRYDETKKLLNWIFAHYQWVSFDQVNR